MCVCLVCVGGSAQQKRAARLPRLPSAAPGRSLKCCPCQQKRAARLPSQVLRLAASRGGGPETRSGTVQSLKCCACQQKRAARLPSAAPETRSGTVQSLKCCPCQQKRAARLPSVHQGGGPRNALGYCPEPEVLPLPAETSREAPKCCAWRARAPSRA